MSITIRGINGPVGPGVYSLVFPGVVCTANLDLYLVGNTSNDTKLKQDTTDGRKAKLTVSQHEQGPLTIIVQEDIPAAGGNPQGAEVAELMVEIKGSDTATSGDGEISLDNIKKKISDGKNRPWLFVILGVLAAILAGGLFGSWATAGFFSEATSSVEAMKSLTPEAYEALNAPGLYNAWNGWLWVAVIFVSIVITLKALSKTGGKPRDFFAHCATILTATAAVFAIKNLLIAIFHGLPWSLLPLPPLIVAISLLAVTFFLVNKYWKKVA
ncbi:hypothetical protein FWF93_02695 [Candidatus Saccharibacteria bacterium]|nr:hypothetical protein [Candidatus Saccharibacteria bacterium]